MVCGNFILPEPASYVFFYAVFNLRNLLYIIKLRSGNDATTYIPTDEELLEGFQKSKLTNLQTKGILYLIESHIRPVNSATLLLGFDRYSLEHLMPKKWRNNWPACASDDLAKQRDSKLLTLGNLAIIPQALNASIRDSDWATKKSGKGINKPGDRKSVV